MIRRAEPGDLPGLLDLYQHLNPQDPRVPEASAARRYAALLGSDLIRVLASSCLLILVPNIKRAARSFAVIEKGVTHAAHRRQGHVPSWRRRWTSSGPRIATR